MHEFVIKERRRETWDMVLWSYRIPGVKGFLLYLNESSLSSKTTNEGKDFEPKNLDEIAVKSKP